MDYWCPTAQGLLQKPTILTPDRKRPQRHRVPPSKDTELLPRSHNLHPRLEVHLALKVGKMLMVRHMKKLIKIAARAAGAVGAAAVLSLSIAAPADAHYAPSGVWDRLAQCESGGNWKINTGNGYSGGIQFHPDTWRGYGGTKYASHAHKATKSQQIKIAKKVLAGQGWKAWPACSKKLGLR